MRMLLFSVSEPKTPLGKLLLKAFNTLEVIIVVLFMAIIIYIFLKNQKSLGGMGIKFSHAMNLVYWVISFVVSIATAIIVVWWKKWYPVNL